MRSRSIILASVALPSTFAVTLYDFKPRAENVPAACDFIYKSTVTGCEQTDFTGGKGCSTQCIYGLNLIKDQVVKNCFGVTGTSILVNLMAGTGVKDLCPNAASASTATSAPATQAATSAAAKTSTAAVSSSSSAAGTPTQAATSAASSSSSLSVDITTQTLIPVAGGQSATTGATTSAANSAPSSATTSSSSFSYGSNGSPFVYGPESAALEPGVKSGGAAGAIQGAGRLSSSFAFAAFLLGVVGLL